MLWILLLAHFLGDFPLQTNWMARRKSRFEVLTLHVGIHLILMVLFVGQDRALIWPQLLLLTFIHFVQDRLKILFTERYPQRMVLFFFLDQGLHYLAIWGLVKWIKWLEPALTAVRNSNWAIVLIAFLLVTYISFISEKVIYHADQGYISSLEQTKVPRMLSRAFILSLFLLARQQLVANLGIAVVSPYPPSDYRRRAVLTDLVISVAVIILLSIVLNN